MVPLLRTGFCERTGYDEEARDTIAQAGTGRRVGEIAT
jgi:hypothetical protein